MKLPVTDHNQYQNVIALSLRPDCSTKLSTFKSALNQPISIRSLTGMSPSFLHMKHAQEKQRLIESPANYINYRASDKLFEQQNQEKILHDRQNQQQAQKIPNFLSPLNSEWPQKTSWSWRPFQQWPTGASYKVKPNVFAQTSVGPSLAREMYLDTQRRKTLHNFNQQRMHAILDHK